MPKAKKSTLKRFVLSYAYDVPRYEDFIVTAVSEHEAEKKAEAALKAGKLTHVIGEEFDNRENHRVFLNRAFEDDDDLPTLDQLCQKPEN